MAFISASLLAEPPLILLSDDDSLPCCTSTQTPTTTDLMDFAEQSPADRLYDEIYRKNIVKFLATGGFASRTTDTDRVAVPSLIDEQDTRAASRRGAYRFDYGSGAEVELEFEVPDELLLCLSPQSHAEGRRHSVVQQDLVCSSDEATGCGFVGAEDSNNGLERKETPRSLPDRPQPVWTGSDDYSPARSDLLTPDYLGGDSSSSSSEPKSKSAGDCPPSLDTTRRLIRINLPNNTLHTMQEDPRFDGVCHAWVRRPDFCRFGVSCDFSHEYPPALAKKYGMIAVYVRPNGKEVKNAAEFLKLEETFGKTQWRRQDQGAKIHSPGCYEEDCRAFLTAECGHGDKCWYRHPKTVVEGGRCVTKDVRRRGEHRDIGDGFRGDRRASVCPPLPSAGARPSMPADINTPPPSVYKGDWASVVPGRDMHTAANPSTPGSSSENSSGVRNELSLTASRLYDAGPASSETRPALTARSHISPAVLEPATHWTTVFPKPSTAPITTNSGNRKDYNYWGDEIAVPDRADYWRNSSPARVSRSASRQQAFAVEAMTYDQLFSRNEDWTEPQSPRRTPKFVMPAMPADTRREPESRRILERKISLAHARQETQDRIAMGKDNNWSDPSCGQHDSIHGTKLIDEPAGDWTKSLKEMLAQRRKGSRGTLIEF